MRRGHLHWILTRILIIGSFLGWSEEVVFMSYASMTQSEAEASGSDLLIQGLVDLKFNRRKQAFETLEKGFRHASSLEQKSHFALLLAQADPRFIQGKKHLYAEFCLENHPNLSVEIRVKLHLVMADGYFEAGNIKLAKRGYQAVISESQSPIEDQEYAHFKVGWVYLNEKRPDLAYQVWLDWLNQHQNEGLRPDFLKNLGKAFVEQLRVRNKIPNFSYHPRDEQEMDLISKGIYSGIVRDRSNRIQDLKKAFPIESVWSSVVNQVLRSQVLFEKNPCDCIQWIESSQREGLDQTAALAGLARCGQRLDQMPAALRWQKKQTQILQSQLLNAYTYLDPPSGEKWPLAELQQRLGKETQACESFQEIYFQFLEDQKADKDLEQIMIRLVETCLDPKVPQDSVVSFAFNLAQNAVFVNRFKSITSQDLGLMIRFLASKEIRQSFFKGILEKSEVWKVHPKKTWVTTLAVNQKDELALDLLKTLYSQGERQTELGLVASSLKHALATYGEDEGLIVLKELLPLAKVQTIESLRLWIFYMVQTGSHQQLKKVIVKLTEIKEKEPPSQKDLKTLALILLESNRLSLLTHYWSLFGPVIEAESELSTFALNHCLKATTTLAKDDNCEFSEVASPSPWVKYTKASIDWLENRDWSNILDSPPSILASTVWVKELSLFRKIQVTQAQYLLLKLRDSAELEQQIRTRMQELSTLKAAVMERTQWNFPEIKKGVYLRFDQMVEALAGAIERVELSDRAAEAELKQVSEMIRQWRLG